MTDNKRAFEKVGPCLYRYTTTGTYYALVKVKGKQVRRSLGTDDRALAKRRLADLHRDLLRVDVGAGRISLADLCERFLTTVANQSASTLEQKSQIAKRIKNEWPGGSHVPIGKVTPSSIAAWLASYSFGASSHNHHLLFVRAAFQMAVDDKLLAHSPAAGLVQRKREKPIRRTPTFAEFQRIVADVRSQRFNADHGDSADFIEFLGLAGLGQAEAGSLRWCDVDWPNEQMITFRHKTRQGFAVPIYPQLRPLLERLRDARPADSPSESRVFRIKDAKKALAGACRRLDLPGYSQRSLRRMFITRAIERGVDVKVIAEWQGHRDGGKLILDTYSHVAPKHSARMAKLMSEETEE
jgi:integrase